MLDVDGRNRVLEEARQIIHEIYNLDFDSVGNAQVDQILADAKVQLLKKRTAAQRYAKNADSQGESELMAATGEESAAMLVALALPEERLRIQDLLAHFPEGIETKTEVLITALKQIWQKNPDEKVVIFATYLGTVDAIKEHLGKTFLDKGVEVLKGGDHGAKTAAQKRFRRKDGPNVLVCTVAGREGINLQFARVLFNYDLPWNPMDLEQRIGRIHRYGQDSTAQVYNLVAADTIEGKIFLLLEEKLEEIANALGKVDEHGQVAEDLRGQVLGQLGSSLSYDRLYQDALDDPTLQRTRQELEVAMSNATEARQVVFELFQDLDRFNLGDYQKYDDEGQGMQRLVNFISRSTRLAGDSFNQKDATLWMLKEKDKIPIEFTSDRDRAVQNEKMELFGLEHPVVKRDMQLYLNLAEHNRAVFGRIEGVAGEGLLIVWKIDTHAKDGQSSHHVVNIAMTDTGERAPWLERLGNKLLTMEPAVSNDSQTWQSLATEYKQRSLELLHRELLYSGVISDEMSYSAKIVSVFGVEN
ncbi:MAG: hypothetical protein GQ559_07975 [Desulfobulbaceae bacterium]|nr:hypothetical protein [Desulfobulbaceae bacterium]